MRQSTTVQYEQQRAPFVVADSYQVLTPAQHGGGVPTFDGVHTELAYSVLIRTGTSPTDSRVSQEAEAIRQLTHINNARLLVTGCCEAPHDPVPFAVYECPIGRLLSDVLATQRFGALRTLRLAKGLAAAVAEAHAVGIVHGDLQPAWITLEVLGEDHDRPTVMGYGVRRAEQRLRISADDMPSPHIVAPQHAHTPGAVATISGDVYALSAILYRCLVGRDVEAGVTPTPIRDVVPAPAGLEAIISRGLSSDPAARFADAGALLEALEQLDEADTAGWSHEVGRGLDPNDPTWSGVAECPEARRLAQVTHLQSSERPTIWLMTGAPATDHASVRLAAEQLGETFSVEILDAVARSERVAELARTGSSRPWIVIFEDLHVLLGDPLLMALSHCPETSRMLVSSHANLDLAAETINTTGLDHHVVLPTSAEQITAAAQGLLGQSLTRRRMYDHLRLGCPEAHSQAAP